MRRMSWGQICSLDESRDTALPSCRAHAWTWPTGRDGDAPLAVEGLPRRQQLDLSRGRFTQESTGLGAVPSTTQGPCRFPPASVASTRRTTTSGMRPLSAAS